MTLTRFDRAIEHATSVSTCASALPLYAPTLLMFAAAWPRSRMAAVIGFAVVTTLFAAIGG